MSGYGCFSEFYDRLTTDVDYAAYAEYLLSLFERHKGERPSMLLDLACGSGSLALEMAVRGIDVIGVDGSEEMLAIASEKAQAAGRQLLFLCQDMRKLDLYGTVDGAVCVLDSLNHVTNTAGLAEIFRRLSLFIEPGGLFIFDVNTPYKHREVLADNTFVMEEEDLVCVWRNECQPRTCTVSMLLDFFVEQEDGRYERLTDLVKERAYSLDTLRRMLKENQFETLAVYGERTLLPPEPDCPRWVVVATNRRNL